MKSPYMRMNLNSRKITSNFWKGGGKKNSRAFGNGGDPAARCRLRMLLKEEPVKILIEISMKT